MNEQTTRQEKQRRTFVWKIFERRFEVSCDGELFANSSSMSTFGEAVADMFRLSGKGPVSVVINSASSETRTIEELQAEIATLTAQNVILGMGILEIGECALHSTGQQIKDKAIAIHKASQAAHAPSAVEAEIAKLKAERDEALRKSFRGVWRCFHCDEIFDTPGGAQDHFGGREGDAPGCLLKVTLGDERGWLMELRKEQEACDQQLQRALNAEREVERLECRVGSLGTGMKSIKPFAKCDSMRDVFNVYDSMEGRALAAEENIAALKAEVARLSAPVSEWLSAPDKQGWWWHFQGEDYRPAFMYSVMRSGTNGEYFLSYPDSRWCKDLGGFWLYADFPNVPTREEQAIIAARSNPPGHGDAPAQKEQP